MQFVELSFSAPEIKTMQGAARIAKLARRRLLEYAGVNNGSLPPDLARIEAELTLISEVCENGAFGYTVSAVPVPDAGR